MKFQFLDEMFGIIIICLQAFSFYVVAVASFRSTFLSSRSIDLYISSRHRLGVYVFGYLMQPNALCCHGAFLIK